MDQAAHGIITSMNEMNILWVGKSYTSTNCGVKPHAHPYYHMFCLLDGRSRFFINGREYNEQGDSIILVPKHVRHEYANSGDALFQYLEIKFTLHNSPLESLLPKSEPCIAHSTLARELCCQIVGEYSESGTGSDEAALSYLSAVINLITEDIRKEAGVSSHYIDISSYSELSRRIVEYLEEHYSEDVVLDDLAACLNYNKAYLCTAFKNDTHTTILDSLNTIRIRHAAELIVYSDNSLSQVAQMCGFSSDSHFNSVFSKYVGITPGQCRKAYPDNVLFGTWSPADSKSRPDRFIYSVLGRKMIPREKTAANNSTGHTNS